MNSHFLDYELPDDLIAQTPAEPRDSSRLLVVDREHQRLSDRTFSDLPEILLPGDMLVANDSRVIPARLAAQRVSGASVEILLLEKLDNGIWEAMVRPLGRLRAGERLIVRDRHGHPTTASVEFVRREGALGHVRLEDDSIAEAYGRTPLPPYIASSRGDSQRYQTVYASESGSAAAPTAGLHFTPELLARCLDRDIEFHRITLHVGIDTFRPIMGDQIEDHAMHSEWYSVQPDTWRKICEGRRRGRRVVSVGTTTTRVLETLAAHGQPQQALTGRTSIYIRPPYRFGAVDAQITNFHLPRTTLLLMIGAFAGDRLLRRAYAHAIQQRYRFYSFGDAMLIV